MKLFRVIALLLALVVGAGAALLDPCLIGCHEPVQHAAVPACHGTMDSTGTSITGTAECGHDHTGLEADTPLESRLTSVRHAAQPAITLQASPSLEAPRDGGRVPPLLSHAVRPHVPLRPQLRV